jgi:hypothetical protein
MSTPRTSQAQATHQIGARLLLLSLLLNAATIVASAQDGTSLGDIARQARAQKPAADQAAPSKAQELANELQQEQEESENAPLGYRTYNAGDYRLYVPYPYDLEGRNNLGTVIGGSRVGSSNTEVMVGNPIPIGGYDGDISDDNVARGIVRQLAALYGQSTWCGPTKVGERRAFKCSWARGFLIDHEVWGSMIWIFGSSSIIPVMCANPDSLNDPSAASGVQLTYREKIAATQQRMRDQSLTIQACEQIIYPSIRLKEDDSHHAQSAANPSQAMTAPAKSAQAKGLATMPNPTAALVPTAVKEEAQSAGGPSVADLARQAKQAAAQSPKAQLAMDGTGGALAPKGFKTQQFTYCSGPGNCWMGTVFVPENAVPIHVYYSELMFDVPLADSKVMLFAGPTMLGAIGRPSNDPELTRWGEMDTEPWATTGRVRALRNEQATIAGKPGILTHFELDKNGVTWVAARAKVEVRGVEVMVGCMAPQAHFADADQICSTLMDSLRLP